VTWDEFWTSNNLSARAKEVGEDAAGNTPSYIIDRMCQFAEAPTSGGKCLVSPDAEYPSASASGVSVTSGNSEDANDPPIDPPAPVYYRITVRTVGPRDTVSYIQAFVWL
jgi:type IV pilus assembly protein PilX